MNFNAKKKKKKKEKLLLNDVVNVLINVMFTFAIDYTSIMYILLVVQVPIQIEIERFF